MGWFDWFRRRSSVEQIDDLVWLTANEKQEGIRERLRVRLQEDQLVLLITHFPETFNCMQDLLEQSAMDYEVVNDRLHGMNVVQLLEGAPKVALVPANAVIEGEETLPPAGSPNVSIFVAERHPIRTPDHLVEAFARSIPCSIRLSYFLSADEPLMKFFVTPAGVNLLRTVGSKNHAVSSRMITRRITRAQRRLEQQVGRPKAAESPQEWLRLNVGEED